MKLLPLVFSATILCFSVAGFSQDDSWKEKHSELAEQTAQERRQAIHDEIAQLENHPWAGEYFHGDGLGTNARLSISPGAGYVYENHGCLGLYDRNYGKVTEKDGQLTLTFDLASQRNFGESQPDLQIIKWGERTYLIPDEEIIDFCNWINNGFEPRGRTHGFYFLRTGDEQIEVTGFPQVPEKYQSYLLEEPIHAKIISIDKTKITEGDPKKYYYEVTIDQGRESGIKAGMKMRELTTGNANSIKITEVKEANSKATITDWGNYHTAPDPGDEFTTHIQKFYDAILESDLPIDQLP